MTKSNKTIIRPKTVDGIELYSTHVGCGMSQVGLSRFVGVDEKAIRDLLSKIPTGQVTELQDIQNLEIFLPVHGFKNAKIVSSRVCAAICSYYAYKARNTTETAKYSLEKFASIGIDTWIQKEVGAGSSTVPTIVSGGLPDITMLFEQTLRLHEELLTQKDTTISLQDTVIRSQKFITNAISDSPGLERLLVASQVKQPTLGYTKDGEPVTLTLLEWLEHEGHTAVNSTLYRKFRLKVSQTFQSLKDRSPKKEWRSSAGGNSINPYVYTVEDFPLLKTVFEQVLDDYLNEIEGSEGEEDYN